MCNRFRMTAKQAELAAAYGIAAPYPADITIPPPELFPKRPAYVVRQHNGARLLDTMSWGFPHTITGKSGKPIEKAITNVRNYTSPFWRGALATPGFRCLVPFTAFSEYGPGEPGKVPLHWFTMPSRPIPCFAGVWRPVKDGKAFAFLTCEPNPLVAPIHPKAMPVILHEEDYDRWLAAPYPSQLMAMDQPG